MGSGRERGVINAFYYARPPFSQLVGFFLRAFRDDISRFKISTEARPYVFEL